MKPLTGDIRACISGVTHEWSYLQGLRTTCGVDFAWEVRWGNRPVANAVEDDVTCMACMAGAER